MECHRPHLKQAKSSDVYSCFSLFDPQLLPVNKEELSSYGESEMQVLTDFYGELRVCLLE